MSGALAAALAAGCCCTRDRDGGGGGADPECPQAALPFEETADASIDTVNASFSINCIARAMNVGRSLGACEVTPEETYEEIATASASGGQLTLNFSGGSAAWTGCGSGGASVTALRHGRTNRQCGTLCECLGNPPGCWNSPCCGQGPYPVVRHHSCGILHNANYLRLGDPLYSPDQIEVAEIQNYSCPECCDVFDPPVPVGVPVSGWTARVGMRIDRFCRLWPGETPEPCYCTGSDVLTFAGYSLTVGVAIYSEKWMAQLPNSCGSPFLGNPLGSGWRVWKALYSKPCCSANDTVKGTYRICHPTSNSGSVSGPGACYSTYEVVRSSTATVS